MKIIYQETDQEVIVAYARCAIAEITHTIHIATHAISTQ